MNLWPQISRQRIQHIVDSYSLDEESHELFSSHLNELLSTYPSSVIELALVQVLSETWNEIPPPRGTQFLDQVQSRLQHWKATTVELQITPAQFQQITGLDPDPVFGSSSDSPPACALPPL